MKVKFDINQGNNISLEQGNTPKEIVAAFRQAMFEQREAMDNTLAYRKEKELFNCVRNGKMQELTEMLREISVSEHFMGCMSKDPIRQALFTFISVLTLMTRSAIEGGLPEIEAYNLSDVYSQKADVCKSIEELTKLLSTAFYDFTRRVQQGKKARNYSYSITRCIEYILNHLHYPITLAQLSAHCRLTPQYLSSLFKKETGMTITEYIMNEKLETAKQMLAYSELSLQEISNYLAFSTHSNFTAHFKKTYGMTPRQYRNSCGV